MASGASSPSHAYNAKDNFFQHSASGINHIVHASQPGIFATSTVQLDVSVTAAGTEAFRVNLLSTQDKIRPTQRVRSLGFSADGRLLFTSAGDELAAWDWRAGQKAWSYVPPRAFGFLIISPVAIATTLGFVAAAFDNGSLGVWSDDGTCQCLWKDNDAPRQLAFCHQGKHLVGTDSFSLCVWDWHAMRQVHKRRLRDRVYGFAHAASHDVIALRTLREVSVAPPDSDEVVAQFPVDPGLPLLAFHPHAPTLAFAGQHGIAIANWKRGERVPDHQVAETILALDFDATGTALRAGTTTVLEFGFDGTKLIAPMAVG